MSRPGILFDLDGTLVDTAPDLVAVLNRMLLTAGRPPIPFAIARNEVSNGAIGLIRLGFDLADDDPVDPELRAYFLELYEQIGHIYSRLFIALHDIINITSSIGAAWGIVTNKPEALTASLLEHLGIRGQLGALVCGDTLPQRKPHPAPLLHAADILGCEPASCIYLGDAQRDIAAGRAAGMRTIATTYGYIRLCEPVPDWRADTIIDHPRKIATVLRRMTESSL